MKITNFRIGTRLGAAFAALLLLLTLLTATAVWRLHGVGAATQRMVDYGLANERRVAEWASIIDLNAERGLSAARAPDAADEKALVATMAISTKRADEIKKELDAAVQDPAIVALFEQATVNRKDYIAARNAVLKEKAANGPEAARALIESQMKPKLAVYLASVAELRKLIAHHNDELAQVVQAQYESGRNILITTNALALVIGVLLAVTISRSITRPLQRAVTVARTVADCDLRQRVDSDSRDECGELLRALRDMNGSLETIVHRVRGSTTSMSTACVEIANGNLDLSQRTEEQASSLQQTAASMEEITSTVKLNYDNAQRASELADSASQIAERGGTIVSQVVGTMGSINDASRKIVDIIGVIDSIAFQTNILALNAAVEAARAGEQGRGFAVVAGEVRTLAQRSGSAAREIKNLIQASVDQVETGARQVDEAGRTMEELVRSVKRVSDIMGEITVASREQTSGIEQINQAVSEMDRVTQQNAAMVEEAAAASASLQDQAANLASAVSVFRTSDSPAGASAPTAAHAASPDAHAPARRKSASHAAEPTASRQLLAA